MASETCRASPHHENRLLAALDPADFARLEPHLEKVDLERGRELSDGARPPDFAWFPHESVLSIVASMREGRVAEMAAVGREGVLGVSAALGGGPLIGRAMVQVAGCASRIGFERLRAAALESPRLRHVLALYTEALLAQAFQLTACNALHPVEARCCRWILMTQDRVRGAFVPLTQEYLAEMLGVQRSTVTAVSRSLQAQGMLTARRGSVSVADRARLEAAACECYGLIRQSFERLLPRTYD